VSFFNEVQKDALTAPASQAARGPRLGYLASFEAAWDAQARTESFYADAYAFEQEEARQIKTIKDAGYEPPPSMIAARKFMQGIGVFEDVASYYNNGENADVVSAELLRRNQVIEKIRKERPELGLKTYDELWQNVRQKAKAAEEKWENSETTTGGALGGFLGGTLASLDPRTDPLNAATLGVGGAGRTALRRIGGEVGAQAAIESVNQFTGVSSARERLGLDNSMSRAAMSVAAVAGGAGVLRAAGEGLGYLGRRWFREAPNDIPPPPPEPAPKLEGPAPRLELPYTEYMGPSRRAKTVLDADYDAALKQLDEGTPPWALRPATQDVTLPRDISNTSFRLPEFDVEKAIARADPETWRMYTKLQERADRLRVEIDNVGKIKEDAGSTAALLELDKQLAALTETAQAAKGKKLAKLQAQIADLEAARIPLAEAVSAGSGETAARRQSELRQTLFDTDVQMRELAVPLSRARAAAEGEWQARNVRPEVADWLRTRNPDSEVLQKAKWQEKAPEKLDLSPQKLEQRVPAKPGDPPGMTPVARAEARAAEALKEQADLVEEIGVSVKSPALDIADEFVMPDGTKVSPDQRLLLPDEDGNIRELTARDLVREMREDQDLIESVSACSLVKTS
jgi:hypothetical protein